LAEAKECGAHVRVFRNPHLELDIDELDDLRRLSNRLRPDSATARWLIERGVDLISLLASGLGNGRGLSET